MIIVVTSDIARKCLARIYIKIYIPNVQEMDAFWGRRYLCVRSYLLSPALLKEFLWNIRMEPTPHTFRLV